jgi:hypothetical protein
MLAVDGEAKFLACFTRYLPGGGVDALGIRANFVKYSHCQKFVPTAERFFDNHP